MQTHWRKGFIFIAAFSAGISGWIVGCGGDDQFLNVNGTDSGTTDATATDSGKLDASGDSTTPTDGGTKDGSGDGSTTTNDGGDGGDAGPPSFAGVTTPFDQWTWVPIAGAVCADGSPTGIAVNPHAGSTNLTVYFEGGGACWTDATCQANAATPGTPLASYLTGYGEAQFGAEFGDAGTGGPLASTGVFQRSGSPLAEENFVYVPYCTGDIHAGNNVATYGNESDGGTFQIHHVGYANATLDLAAVKATYPTVSRLVVTGSSAGGYGALFNYEQIHKAYPGIPSFLIDDSGPPLAGTSEYAAQEAKWHSQENLPSDCVGCAPGDGGAFVNIFPYLTKQDSNFKGSLLETDHDEVISTFFSAPPPGGTAVGLLVQGNENNAGCANSDGGVGDAGLIVGPCDFTSFLDNVVTGGVQAANTAGPGQMHAFIENAAFHTYLLTPDKYAAVAPFLASQLGQDGGLDGGWTDQIPAPF